VDTGPSVPPGSRKSWPTNIFADFGESDKQEEVESWRNNQGFNPFIRPCISSPGSGGSFLTPGNYRKGSTALGAVSEDGLVSPDGARVSPTELILENSFGPPSQSVNPQSSPGDTSSGLGTYSCTYHGCYIRFETPAKLLKHKREDHRHPSSPSPSVIRDLNSQTRPFRCEQINPSTGKPCRTIFSRPYDLTRHEDTIHNARKPKIRCLLCTEEKSFSRSDAMARHMRVVHPDMDWPRKSKKRKRDQNQ
jgi:Zinc finger, C2H2 type